MICPCKVLTFTSFGGAGGSFFLASCSASFFRQHKTLEADAFRWLMVGCALFSSAKEIS